jgi:Na+-driven multidrug efflux pump
MMGLSANLLAEAGIFLQIVGGLSFIQALIMTFSAILKSYGHTKDTMVVTIGMNILNIAGNYLVIFGPFGFPVLGVAGVAMSTSIARIIACSRSLCSSKSASHADVVQTAVCLKEKPSEKTAENRDTFSRGAAFV